MVSLFSYAKTDSPVHRTPAIVKLMVVLAVPFTVYRTPLYVCLGLMALFALCAVASKTGFKNFLMDLKPIVIYSLFILAVDVISHLLFHSNDKAITRNSIGLILKLLCAMESASVFFRTTSTYEIQSTLQTLLGKTAASVFTLFLGFLPRIFATWTDLELAYKARGGKGGILKPVKLLPLLISISIKRASTTYLALLNRS